MHLYHVQCGRDALFNFNHLYYFYVTALHSSVTRAARDLRVSQPSLSSQLKALERALGKALFRKEGRGLVLSQDGHRVFSYCRQMFEEAEKLRDALDDKVPKIRIRIGATDEIDRSFIAEISGVLCARLGSTRPHVSLQSGRHPQLLELLLARELDVLLTDKPVPSEAVAVLAVVTMPIVLLATPALEKLARDGAQRLSPTALLRASPTGLVVPAERLKLRHETDSFLHRQRISKRIEFESDILAAVVRAAAAGMGFGLLPLPYAERELELGTLRAVEPIKRLWTHRIFLATRKTRTVEGPIASLVDILASIDRKYQHL